MSYMQKIYDRRIKKVEDRLFRHKCKFFHIKFKKKIPDVENIFKKNKILVRKGPGVKGFERYLRFSLGSKNQIKKIIQIVKKIN